MDYSLIREEEMSKRFDASPQAIFNLLNSEDEKKTVEELARLHYLDEEKKTILEQLIGLILLGFISPADLAVEINENLYLNLDHSKALAEEINQKIFEPVKDDLKKVYAPVGGPYAASWERVEAPETPELTPFRPIAPEGIPQTPGGPLIIHEEKGMPERKVPAGFRLFGFPKNLIRTTGREEEGGTRATIEIPKSEKRVVHYSELRTPVSPFNKEGAEIVSLEAFKEIKPAPPFDATPVLEMPPPETIVPPQAKKGFWRPEIAKKPGSAEDTSPKLEGNTVDLR